ncbi:RNA polymerase sigma factor [Roseivirga misakiensis]|uniref:RNA polymerase subunit sigma-70 n=1 Tax=Roseivirga misakiensis TaxID=1563681 RepID=A0A1E5T2Z3_9BACT|nr:sigma-70 family RNA polymerase sigma factor [Roseivirga misakiensis]OEK05750.1 RNA polymerase subunit sigma-70 [Roseivirga misakiensis]
MSDQDLILALQQRSENAFRTLVGQYQDRVYNTCLGLLQNAEEAEEAAQDVFIEVYKSVPKFRGDAKLSTWIYRIATTKSLEVIRKRKTQKRFAFLQSLTGGDQDYENTKSATFNHPGVILENKEHAETLFKAIKELPDSQRIAFTLHKVEGLPYQEIAEVLETSVSSVESLMFRARKNLQKKLKSYYEKNLMT